MVWSGRILGTACVLVAVSFVCPGPVQADPGLATAAGGRTRVVRQVSHAVFRPGIDDPFRTDIIYGGKDADDTSAGTLSSKPFPGSGLRNPPIRFGPPLGIWV